MCAAHHDDLDLDDIDLDVRYQILIESLRRRFDYMHKCLADKKQTPDVLARRPVQSLGCILMLVHVLLCIVLCHLPDD